MFNFFTKLQLAARPKAKQRIRKPKVPLYPRAIERDYEKQLIKINSILTQKINEIILPQLPRLIAMARLNRPDARQDDWTDDVEELVNSVFSSFESLVATPFLNQIALEQALEISGFNKKQFFRSVESALSINPFINEPYLQEQMRSFQKNNTNLITKMAQDQKDKLNNLLFQSLSEGKGQDAIAKDLEGIEGIGKRRAILIARDQTNKFNGQLTQLRQQELGVKQYKWLTARDERVRPTHRARDGKIYNWNDNDIKPGEEIRCRCVAIPVIDDSLF